MYCVAFTICFIAQLLDVLMQFLGVSTVLAYWFWTNKCTDSHISDENIKWKSNNWIVFHIYSLWWKSFSIIEECILNVLLFKLISKNTEEKQRKLIKIHFHFSALIAYAMSLQGELKIISTPMGKYVDTKLTNQSMRLT